MRGFLFGFFVGSFLLPVIAALVFLLGLSPIQATADPPRWEAWLASRSFSASVARQAPRLENPVAPTSENLHAGMKIFRDACAGCHGEADKPSQWGTTDFYPRVPQFGSSPPSKPDWQIFWIVRHGVRNSGMGGVDGLMKEEDIWKVTTFLSHMKSLPPDVETEWRGH